MQGTEQLPYLVIMWSEMAGNRLYDFFITSLMPYTLHVHANTKLSFSRIILVLFDDIRLVSEFLTCSCCSCPSVDDKPASNSSDVSHITGVQVSSHSSTSHAGHHHITDAFCFIVVFPHASDVLLCGEGDCLNCWVSFLCFGSARNGILSLCSSAAYGCTWPLDRRVQYVEKMHIYTIKLSF